MPEIIDWWRQEGIEIGMEKGIEKGVRATKLEGARKMLAEGCEWSFISSPMPARRKGLHPDAVELL